MNNSFPNSYTRIKQRIYKITTSDGLRAVEKRFKLSADELIEEEGFSIRTNVFSDEVNQLTNGQV